MRGTALVLLLFAVSLFGCAYPRRSTSLSAVERAPRTISGIPEDIWKLQLVGASIPPVQRDGQPWDEDGEPDPFVRLFRGTEMIWESSPIDDTRQPNWNGETPPRNVWIPRNQAFRIELWDRDVSIVSDPIGVYEHEGLPSSAVPAADVRVMLEGGAELTFRVQTPQPHQGLGISEYEIRSDALIVLEVLPRSPASRGGLTRGDRIVAIGGREISSMDEAQAASALSQSAQARSPLTVVGADGQRREVELDRGYTWLSM